MFSFPPETKSLVCVPRSYLCAALVPLMAVSLMLVPLRFARASDPGEDALIQQGIQAREQHKDARALEYFRQAYALHADARALAQVGLAEFALGDWINAEADLKTALAEKAHPWINKNRSLLSESLSRVQSELGDLLVLGSPVGAEVIIEGQVRGRLPMSQPIRVRVGDCRFDVKAEGFSPISRIVKITTGGQTNETVRLSAAIEQGNVATAGRRTDPKPAENKGESGGSTLRTTGIVLGALGAATVVGGIVFGALAKSAGEENSSAGHTFDPGLEDRGKSYQTLQYVGLGGGAALLLAGAACYVRGFQSTSSDQVTASVVLNPDGGSISAIGRF